MGALQGVVEPLPTVGYVSVALLGVVQRSRQVVETCAPHSYGSSEGEERLQHAGFSSEVPVVALDGLRAGCVCLLNRMMLGQVVLGPVQTSEFLSDGRFQTACTFRQFWDSPEPTLDPSALQDECVNALLGRGRPRVLVPRACREPHHRATASALSA